MRIFNPDNQAEIKRIMHDIGVDPYGSAIMVLKALNLAVYLNKVDNIAANILKQEMLSIGAEAAVARGSLTGKVKKTDVLLTGTLAQFNLLISKLQRQPFGLNQLGRELKEGIANYQKNKFTLRLPKGTLSLSGKTRIMGIINLTPDSFSGDGLYQGGACSAGLVLKKALQMKKDGADILDLGGESSRPGAKSISAKEEMNRVTPAIRLLAKKTALPISIDTSKPEVAEAALDSGAQIINDITGLKDKRMLRLAARYKAAVVIMHMLGKPLNMQKIISYRSLIEDISLYLKTAVQRAESAGITSDRIIIDPGIGFGKTPEHNLELLKRLADFKLLGKPILVGPSRKSFIAKVLDDQPESRMIGTIASCLIAQASGANIVRVHDVKEINQSLRMAGAINNAD